MSRIVWAYGVTTVPKRFNDPLPRTLASLKKAGFDNPRLFIDGSLECLQEEADGCPRVLRSPSIKAYGNWILSLWELYVRQPNCDRYALFQDDIVLYPNLRHYLETFQYPQLGYWNLITYPSNSNDPTWDQGIGWQAAPRQKGKGAQALVFDNATVKLLLQQKRIVDKPSWAGPRKHKSIDGVVSDALHGDCGYLEYVHNPSLVQHTGAISVMGNPPQPDAPTFKGEDFNALDLLT